MKVTIGSQDQFHLIARAMVEVRHPDDQAYLLWSGEMPDDYRKAIFGLNDSDMLYVVVYNPDNEQIPITVDYYTCKQHYDFTNENVEEVLNGYVEIFTKGEI